MIYINLSEKMYGSAKLILYISIKIFSSIQGTAFVCSAAMGLPVSGFPNMNAVSQENELGKPYLKTTDFLRNGVPSSFFCMICIATIGYGLMTLVGF